MQLVSIAAAVISHHTTTLQFSMRCKALSFLDNDFNFQQVFRVQHINYYIVMPTSVLFSSLQGTFPNGTDMQYADRSPG